MFRRSLTTALVVVSLVSSSLPSSAEEGMWMPDALDKLPLGEMKKRGFELKPEEVWSSTKTSLKDAIVKFDPDQSPRRVCRHHRRKRAPKGLHH
jgi:hypothetical protein